MAMDRKDFDDLNARRRKIRHVPEDKSSRRIAKVLADKLSTSPEWNRLKEHAAGRIVQCESLMEGYQQTLLSPSLVSQDELMKAKIGYHSHMAALNAYKDILEYPEKFKSIDTDMKK